MQLHARQLQPLQRSLPGCCPARERQSPCHELCTPFHQAGLRPTECTLTAPQASIASLVAFSIGGVIPLLGGIFITDSRVRLAVVLVRAVRRPLLASQFHPAASFGFPSSTRYPL